MMVSVVGTHEGRGRQNEVLLGRKKDIDICGRLHHISNE